MTALYFSADELSNVARSFLTFYDRMASKCILHSPHVSHSNGFSPLCMRWWLCNVDSSLNARPHIVQLCGRSFVWYDKWRWYDCWNVNVRWHSSHEYGISPKTHTCQNERKNQLIICICWLLKEPSSHCIASLHFIAFNLFTRMQAFMLL